MVMQRHSVAPQAALQQLSNYAGPPTGRITLTTAVPVLTAAVTGAATVFYTPYIGALAPIWDGTRFQARVFAQVSNVLANSATGNAGPAAGAASKNYDLFLWDNAGTITLTRGGAWNSDTARSATTENDLVVVNGLQTNLNAITNGPAASFGTYVGTIRTDAGGATVTYDPGSAASGGGLASFGVWNAYNWVEQTANVADNGTSDTYNGALRARRGSATFRCNLVAGLNLNAFSARHSQLISTPAVATSFGAVYVGLDTTNTATTNATRGQVYAPTAAVVSSGVHGHLEGLPGLGFHFISGNESADGTNSFTSNNATQPSVLAVKWKW